MEAVQPRQQPVAQGRLAGPQGDAARLQAHGLFQLFPAPAELLAARLHMGVEHAAFGRELHAAPVADDRRQPSSRSRAAMERDTAGWLVNSMAAARLKLRQRATW